MKRYFTFALLLMIMIGSALAEDRGFDKPASKYLASLEGQHARVFVSSCRTNNGKSILVLPLGHYDGMFFEVQGESIVNIAPAEIKNMRLLLDTANSQGGIYTFTVMQHHAEDAINGIFHLLDKYDLDVIVHSKPGSNCQDRPPK